MLAGMIGRSRVGLVLLLTACGASQPTATTPARRELVVDEAMVVSARRPLREGELPPLPQALDHTSAAFQRGHALAHELLQAPAPSTPPALDDAGYAAWSERDFQTWLSARVAAAQAATDALGAVRDRPASEHVPAAALLGLVFARTHAQLLAVPPPAKVSADAKLQRIYASQLNASAQRWAEQAAAAFDHCSRAAAREAEAAYGLWLELCHQQLGALQRAGERARLLADVVAAEREADRLAAEGPRPDGPQICWGETAAPPPPSIIPGVVAAPTARAVPAAQTPTAVPSAGDATTGSGAAAPKAATTRCARAAHTVADDGGAARSPRDLRYGPRDATHGVRVWAALGDNPTMDASPLLEPATRAALAACFAQHVPPSRAVTVALHATLSIDARGATRSAALTPEPSDLAVPPDAKLSRCLERSLSRVAFDCSPSGQPTQATATFCLRRD
jgi:hypothetical protein